MPTEEEIKEQEEEKDGEKLALGLVGAGILAAGTAVAVSKLADRGGDVRVQKNYADLTSDMNSIPIMDIENRRPPGAMDMSMEQPVEPMPPDPPIQNMAMEQPQPPQQPEPEQPQPPVVSSGGGGGGGNYNPPQEPQPPQQPQPESSGQPQPGGPGVEPTQGGQVQPGQGGPDLVITIPEVENFINKLKSGSKTLKDNWTGIFDTELAKLRDSWAGPDMEEYIKRVEALDPKLQKAIEAVELLMNTYKKAVEAYEEKAKQIQAAMKG